MHDEGIVLGTSLRLENPLDRTVIISACCKTEHSFSRNGNQATTFQDAGCFSGISE
jgi:hypothetical protein